MKKVYRNISLIKKNIEISDYLNDNAGKDWSYDSDDLKNMNRQEKVLQFT